MPTPVRVNESNYSSLVKHAAAEKRSITADINHILEKYFASNSNKVDNEVMTTVTPKPKAKPTKPVEAAPRSKPSICAKHQIDKSICVMMKH